jgi:type II secretory pathway pseudopilin PulG
MFVKRISQHGETIVEVLVAIAVMSAALGSAFAISTRSQKTVQDNQERYQAQLYANQQADLIKLAQGDTDKKQKLDSRDTTKVFCMKTDGDISAEKTQTNLATDTDCLRGYGSPVAFNYRVRVAPSNPGGGATTTYLITVEWDGGNGNLQQVQLVYGT